MTETTLDTAAIARNLHAPLTAPGTFSILLVLDIPHLSLQSNSLCFVVPSNEVDDDIGVLDTPGYRLLVSQSVRLHAHTHTRS